MRVEGKGGRVSYLAAEGGLLSTDRSCDMNTKMSIEGNWSFDLENENEDPRRAWWGQTEPGPKPTRVALSLQFFFTLLPFLIFFPIGSIILSSFFCFF